MPAQENTVKVALIGFGLAGSVFHAPVIHAIDGYELSGIVTANSDRVRQGREKYPLAQIFTSVDELWKSGIKYDLVVVASPNRFHFEHAQAALNAGAHVVVDKPVAATSNDCRNLIALSRKQKKHLVVFQNRRWDNDFLTLRKLIEDGTLGSITRFESRYERYRPEPKPGAWRESADLQDAGGLLYDLGSHLIDQACFLFGTPKSVYAEIDVRRKNVQVDDDVFIAMNFAENVKAHLWASSVARLKGPRFRVLGLIGAYEKFGIDPQELRLRNGWDPNNPEIGLEPESDWGRLSTRVGGVSVDGRVETLPGNYKAFYEQTRDAITVGGANPVNPEDALRTMEIIEAAMQSASSGSLVQIAEAKV